LEKALSQHRWQLNWRSWTERLELPLSASVMERWFAPQAAYRQQLANCLSDAEIEQLVDTVKAMPPTPLPQQLEHRLLIGQQKTPDKPGH
jgi:hypothetical protein